MHPIPKPTSDPNPKLNTKPNPNLEEEKFSILQPKAGLGGYVLLANVLSPVRLMSVVVGNARAPY